MSRVILSRPKAQEYFQLIEQKGGVSCGELAKKLGISTRTLQNWKSGTCSLPLKVVRGLEKDYGVTLPGNAVVRAERDIKSEAGRRGALARNSKYGNPGTLEGRRAGGRRSLITHKTRRTGFKLRKTFPEIAESAELAEFLGIMLGDGGMSKTQVRITLSSRDDISYARYVCQLMYSLFSDFPSVLNRQQQNTLEVVLSGRELVDKLRGIGLVVGNKIEQGVGIPDWVCKKDIWVRRILRGLFDTDGSVYLEKHIRRRKRYKYIRLAFTSHSRTLLDDVYSNLSSLGFSPANSGYSVLLRKRDDVIKFFEEIEPANEKHWKRLRKFI